MTRSAHGRTTVPDRNEMFPWAEYDRLTEEVVALHQAEDSYHTSLSNLEHHGYDDHGVVPGEGAIYERKRAELNAAFEKLGEPPACTECRGCGYVYQGSIETDFDRFPSQCWRCAGTGEYEVVSPPRKPYPIGGDDTDPDTWDFLLLTEDEAIAQGHITPPAETTALQQKVAAWNEQLDEERPF